MIFVFTAIETNFIGPLFCADIHTYLKEKAVIKTCDITYAVRADERGECAINLWC